MRFVLNVQKAAYGSLLMASLLLSACGGGGVSTPAGSSSSASSSAASVVSSSASSVSSVSSSSVSSASSSSSSSVVSSSSSSVASSSSSVTSSSSTSSSSTSSTSSNSYAGPVATSSGGFSTTAGGEVAGVRHKIAATFEEMNAIIAAARVDDAGNKVTAGAYPLVITYTGNEDALINQIVADHTVDASGNCAKAHWNDAYREVSLKNFTKGITIIGAPGSSANFGITIVDGGNVVIRNMKIGALGGAKNDADMIRIDDSSNVWVDHNELFAVNNECNGSPDGDLTFESAIDIKKNSQNITVSYNYIHDSKKVGLDGHTSTDFDRTITFHHNVYKNVNGRLPLQRGGWIHVYNNLYNGITGSGINIRRNGYALIERNWFENSVNPVTCRFDDVCGWWDLRENNLTSVADNATYNITWTPGDKAASKNANNWQTSDGGAVFPIVLPYSYSAGTVACVKAGLASVAGVGKGLATLKCD